MRKSKRWQVQLGEENWARYTYARPTEAGLRLPGSVSRGAQIGALAETAEGRVVQVNGDHVTALSDSQVRRALQPARPPPYRPRHLPWSRSRSGASRSQLFRYLHAKAPVLTVGLPGIGKSHLAQAQALRHRAARQGIDVVFSTCTALAQSLNAACAATERAP